MIEQWVSIKGASRYSVSSFGRVISRCNGSPRLKKATGQGSGYLQFGIGSDDGSYRKRLAHRLVAEAFIPNPDSLPEINHIDGNKHNNNVSNLEWCSRSDNQLHSYAIGLNKARRRTLTEEQKSELLSGVSIKSFVKKHGMAPSTARRLRDEIAAPIFCCKTLRTDKAFVSAVLAHPGSVRRCASDLGVGKTLVHRIRKEHSASARNWRSWQDDMHALIQELEG